MISALIVVQASKAASFSFTSSWYETSGRNLAWHHSAFNKEIYVSRTLVAMIAIAMILV